MRLQEGKPTGCDDNEEAKQDKSPQSEQIPDHVRHHDRERGANNNATAH